MSKPFSITALRAQLFKVVDEIIETGVPADIERNGHRLKIVLAEKKSRLANLKRRDCITVSAEDLVSSPESRSTF